MALPVMNFPIARMNPALSYGAGVNSIEDAFLRRAQTNNINNANTPDVLREKLLKMQLANQLSQVQAKYAEPNAQQDLLKTILANKLSETTLPFAAPKEAAQLATERMRPGYIGAQTDLLRQQSKYLPLKELIAAQSAQRANSRFGPAYQLTKGLTVGGPAYAANWVGQHQDAYNQMLTDFGNAMGQKQGDLITPDVLKQFFPNIQDQKQLPPPGNGQSLDVNAPAAIPSMPGDAARNIIAPMPEELAKQAINSGIFQDQTPEQAKQMASLLNMQVNKKTVGSQIWNRAESAVALEKFLMDNREENAPRLANVAKYAGVIGKGKKTWDAIQAESPQAYQDYKWFVNSFVPNTINQVKQMEKLASSHQQRRELVNMLESGISKMDTDPKSAVKIINSALKTMGEAGNSVIATANPIHKNAMHEVYGLKGIPKDYISDDADIIRVLAPDGITIYRGKAEQMKRLLRDHPDHRRID